MHSSNEMGADKDANLHTAADCNCSFLVSFGFEIRIFKDGSSCLAQHTGNTF